DRLQCGVGLEEEVAREAELGDAITDHREIDDDELSAWDLVFTVHVSSLRRGRARGPGARTHRGPEGRMQAESAASVRHPCVRPPECPRTALTQRASAGTARRARRADRRAPAPAPAR